MRYLLFILIVIIPLRWTNGQYIIYGKPIENLKENSRFLVIGEFDEETTIYFQDAFKNHIIGYYDEQMKFQRQARLTKISKQAKVIGGKQIAKDKILIFYTQSDESNTKQTCYSAQVSKTGEIFNTTALESINYTGNSNIFQLVKSPSNEYMGLYVLGQKDEQQSAIINLLLDANGKVIKRTFNLFPLGIYTGELVEKGVLNDRGGFFFHVTLKDRHNTYKSVRVFFQTKQQQELTSQYIDLTENAKITTTALKPFFNIVNESWNLLFTYREAKKRRLSGIQLVAWEANTSGKQMINTKFSFEKYLLDLKKRVDPFFFEDLELDANKIENKSLLNLVKAVPDEEVYYEENENDDLPPMLEDDDEALQQRFQSLLELLSFRQATIMDIVPKSNGDFMVLMEKIPSRYSRERGKSFTSRLAPSLVVGFGGAISTGFSNSNLGSDVGVSIPLSGASSFNDASSGSSSVKELNDISIFNFTSEGKFTWGNNIEKKQISNQGANLSFFTIKRRDAVYIFYTNQGAPAYVYSILVHPNGKLEVKPTIRGVSAAYSLIPLLAKQTSNNAIVLPCLFKENLVFSRLVYE